MSEELSIAPLSALSDEVATSLDKRRFRANIYAELNDTAGFAEDTFVGHQIRIGERVLLAVVERDSRCKMITIDPDSAQANPEIGRKIARSHGGNAGIYCAVMTEGIVRPGDPIVLLH